MAGGQERILRGRIRTVQATKKITRAMELIAASRIAKAQLRVQAAVPYSDQITAVVKDLAAAGGEVQSPLLAARPEQKTVGYVVLTADRGLCGGYNSSVLRAAEGDIREEALLGRGYALITVGRKAEGYFRFRKYRMAASFSGFSDNPSYADAKRIGEAAISMYERGEIDRVMLVYTRFHSAGVQEVVLRPLVPLDHEVIEGGDAIPDSGGSAGYEFEPSPGVILETLLPRYVEARVYAALLNAAASEHAARQRAMKAATDNAEELIKNLTRVMNRARQDSITTEIMEIVGGAEALRGGGSDEGLAAAVSAQVEAAARLAPMLTLVPDDLEVIEGIGPKINAELIGLGFRTFRQIALLTEEDKQRIYDALEAFEGRIDRENWIGQARELHFQKYGERL